MTTGPASLSLVLAPRAEKTTLTYDITGIDPTNTSYDITRGPDTLFPTRITLNYTQRPDTTQLIEATVKGFYRDRDGMVTYMSDTAEVWRDTPAEKRAPWVTALVTTHTPDWWQQ